MNIEKLNIGSNSLDLNNQTDSLQEEGEKNELYYQGRAISFQLTHGNLAKPQATFGHIQNQKRFFEQANASDFLNTFKKLKTTHVSHKDNEEFYEVTKRISQKEMDVISHFLSQLEDKEKHIMEIKKTIEEFNWKGSIFQNPLYPYYALAGFQAKQLTLAHLTTILFYHTQTSEKTKPGYMALRAIPLFLEDHSINPEVKNILIKSFDSLVRMKELQEEDKENLCHALLEKMRYMPSSECVLFINENQEDLKNLKEVDDFFLDINWVFESHSPRDQDFWMMPSLTLMQTFKDVYYGQEAVKMNPVLGLSSLEDILLGNKKSWRDLAMHFPGVTLPEIADDVPAFRNSFSKHDSHHANQCSKIGPRHCAAFSRLAEVIKDTNPMNYQRLVDLDFDYKHEWRRSDLDKETQRLSDFWHVIFFIFIGRSSEDKCASQVIQESLILKDIIAYEKLYREEWRISIDSISCLMNTYRKQINESQKKETSLQKSIDESTPLRVRMEQNWRASLVKSLEFASKIQQEMNKMVKFISNQ